MVIGYRVETMQVRGRATYGTDASSVNQDIAWLNFKSIFVKHRQAIVRINSNLAINYML